MHNMFTRQRLPRAKKFWIEDRIFGPWSGQVGILGITFSPCPSLRQTVIATTRCLQRQYQLLMNRALIDTQGLCFHSNFIAYKSLIHHQYFVISFLFLVSLALQFLHRNIVNVRMFVKKLYSTFLYKDILKKRIVIELFSSNQC